VVLHAEQNFIVSQPTKLYEYMAASIPVIASDFPLWRSIVAGSRCGMLVDPMDARQIAEAIEYVFDHPGQGRDMGERGRSVVERDFNWENEQQKLLDFYTALLKRTPETTPDLIPADS
jgi:glycosyltransferase involved in cell wall biosynthesis